MSDIEDIRAKLRAELIEEGYTIWIRRQGRCSECGMWMSHAARHCKAYGNWCEGSPKGRRRYSAWVSIVGRSAWHPAGLFPDIAEIVALIERRAIQAREDRVFEVSSAIAANCETFTGRCPA